MNNLIRENLKLILALSDTECDVIAHFNGNDNLEDKGYRNGGTAAEDDPKMIQLREFGLVIGPIPDEGYVEGISRFQLTQRGKDIAETLFWIENGEERVAMLENDLRQVREDGLMDLY